MKKILLQVLILMLIIPALAFATDYSYVNSTVGFAQGGDILFVKSGGKIDVESGGDVDIEGTLDVISGGVLSIESGGTFLVESGATLTVESGFSMEMTNTTGAASSGPIVKLTIDGTGYTGTTSGLIVKNYMNDTGVTVTDGEFTGITAFVKQEAALSGGAKSSLMSLHQHSDSDVNIDFGIRLFGNYNDDLIQFANSSATDGVDMSLATISGNDILLNQTSTESVIKKVVDGSGANVTAGTIIKSYMNDADVAISGNSEFVGLAVFAKKLAALQGGSKSSLISAHQHTDSTVNFDRGLSLFGDVTSSFYLSGSNTNLMYIVSGSEGGFTAASLKDSDGTNIKCDAYFVIYDEAADKDYYLPLYDTLNS